MFKLNLKIALRNLWRNKGFTLINLGGLAIGLASCMMLLLYVNYEYGFDKQFKDHNRIYVAYTNMTANGKTFSWAWTPALLAPELKNSVSSVEESSRSSYPFPQLLSYGNRKTKQRGLFADPSILKILDYKFINGNPASALTNINAIVLTQSSAKKIFGDKNPINETLKLGKDELLTVTAIIEDLPANSSITFDFIAPWKLYEKLQPWTKEQGWGANFCLTLAKLKSEDVFQQTNIQIKDIYKKHQADVNNESFLHPLNKWHLYNEFQNGKSVGGKIDQLKIFFLLAFCILLIACVNFMNLSTARSEKRSREVGVRKAIGSSKSSLIYQFMFESLMMAFLSTILAFILVEVCLPYFNNLLHISLAVEYQNWRYWAVLIGLILITGFIAGSYPALYLSSFEPVKVLKGFSITGNSSFSVRRILVVFQFVFAACLIVCTAVIYQQLNYIKQKPVGYQSNNLIQLVAQGTLSDSKKVELLKQQLYKSGAISNLSTFSMALDEGGNNTSDLSWPGKNPKENILFNERGIGYDFVETIGSQMVDGREFSAQYPSDSSSVIFNEAAIKIMGLKNPIGNIVKWGDTEVKIVGVMKDIVVESPYQKVAPMVFYPYWKNQIGVLLLSLNGKNNVSSSLAEIDRLVKEINPDYPVDRRFVTDSFAEKFEDEQLLGTLSNWFGGFAIFISCLGLLGLALFMAEQRKKEISIRKVLGASTSNILTILNKDFVKLVGIANLIAFPLAYLIINKWLSAYEYRIAISALPFVIAGSLSILIAILTVSIQSIKVAKANAIDALKYE